MEMVEKGQRWRLEMEREAGGMEIRGRGSWVGAGDQMGSNRRKTGGREAEDGDGMETGTDRVEVETGQRQGWDWEGTEMGPGGMETGKRGQEGGGTGEDGNGDGMRRDKMGWRQRWAGHETRWDGSGTGMGVG